MMRGSTLPAILAVTACVTIGFGARAQTADQRSEPSQIALRVARQCQVQPTFVSVERGLDGVQRFQVSPTLTDVQLSCVVGGLGVLGVVERKR